MIRVNIFMSRVWEVEKINAMVNTNIIRFTEYMNFLFIQLNTISFLFLSCPKPISILLYFFPFLPLYYNVLSYFILLCYFSVLPFHTTFYFVLSHSEQFHFFSISFLSSSFLLYSPPFISFSVAAASAFFFNIS